MLLPAEVGSGGCLLAQQNRFIYVLTGTISEQDLGAARARRWG
jgi:hypothetical protein